jgi:hypothetical protein
VTQVKDTMVTFFIVQEEPETSCSEIRQGVKAISFTCQRLFAQIRQVFFDCLNLQFQFAKISFQSWDLLRFGLVTTLEMATAVAASFTTPTTATTFSILILAIAGMALVTFTLLLHSSTSFQVLMESNSWMGSHYPIRAVVSRDVISASLGTRPVETTFSLMTKPGGGHYAVFHDLRIFRHFDDIGINTKFGYRMPGGCLQFFAIRTTWPKNFNGKHISFLLFLVLRDNDDVKK